MSADCVSSPAQSYNLCWPEKLPRLTMAGTVPMKRINSGSQGLEVSVQGLGCMSMSGIYGPPKLDLEMIALIHNAINSSVTFLDTADVCGPHINEILLGKRVRERVELGAKFGAVFVDGKTEIRGDPAYVRSAGELEEAGY